MNSEIQRVPVSNSITLGLNEMSAQVRTRTAELPGVTLPKRAFLFNVRRGYSGIAGNRFPLDIARRLLKAAIR